MTPISAIPPRPDPVSALRRLVRRGASGELVCALSDAEVHVFLQEGRVAWATSSAARFAFARHLAHVCQIDPGAFREVVEECRRMRKPLGETLAEWGIATRDQVRDALRLQVEDAMATLLESGEGETVFLSRSGAYASYDPAFTFVLADVCPRAAAPSQMPDHPPPSTPPSERPDNASALVCALAELTPDVAWAEVVRGGTQVVARHPEPARAGAPRALFAPYIEDADVVAVRCCLRTVLGASLGRRHEALWCGLSAHAPLGSALVALSTVVGVPLSEARATRHPAVGARATVDGPMVVAEILDRAPEVLGVELLSDRERRALGTRAGFVLGPDEVRPIRDTLRAAQADPRQDPSQPIAHEVPSMVRGAGGLWYFASALLDDSGRVVVLTLDRSASGGLGWALLAALVRRLPEGTP